MTFPPRPVGPDAASGASVSVAACAEAASVAEAMDSAQWHRLWTAARGRPLP